MQAIGIFSRKGGVGKSTLAIHLSTLAAAEGRTLLVDGDPQASLEFWWRRRPSGTFGLARKPIGEIARLLHAARSSGVRYVVVDTPPGTDAAAEQAMAAFDLILLPLRPTTLDLASVVGTVAAARDSGTPYGCVLNMCPPRRGFTVPAPVQEVTEILTELGAPVFAATLSHRVSFQNAINSGETVTEFEPAGSAAAEVAALWDEIRQRLSEQR